MKQVKDIEIEDLSWHEFKKLFWKNYFSERYYNSKVKEFYELIMGSMTNEEYMNKFLELLGYVLYLKYEKAKVQFFFSEFPLAFLDRIEYVEPR